MEVLEAVNIMQVLILSRIRFFFWKSKLFHDLGEGKRGEGKRGEGKRGEGEERRGRDGEMGGKERGKKGAR